MRVERDLGSVKERVLESELKEMRAAIPLGLFWLMFMEVLEIGLEFEFVLFVLLFMMGGIVSKLGERCQVGVYLCVRMCVCMCVCMYFDIYKTKKYI